MIIAISIATSIVNSLRLRLAHAALRSLFTLAPKTSQELKFQLYLSNITARCTYDKIATTKIRWPLVNCTSPYSFLPGLPGVLTSLATARPYYECSQKQALNLFGRFIQLVYETAARVLPMYIPQNTRHPPHRQHF